MLQMLPPKRLVKIQRNPKSYKIRMEIGVLPRHEAGVMVRDVGEEDMQCLFDIQFILRLEVGMHPQRIHRPERRFSSLLHPLLSHKEAAKHSPWVLMINNNVAHPSAFIFYIEFHPTLLRSSKM